MPAHPVTRPPSPTARFLQGSTASKRLPHEIPGTFFIFADISLRKAGEYRLLFTLMKMGSDALKPGSRLPFIDVVVSDMFRAVNAKDFDQVHPSTPLVRGLLSSGAGFPLKLKKGTREGRRRRQSQGGSGGSEDDESGDHDTVYY
ncbi:hypothetical protein CLCR_10971 [Cladophialophora carrionii]|uniref:Velvet domain-containing protein n=2 Tax=Cladophialophora carrionii TaxID=86049 RepID=A0A1C1CZK4_9EURO|nr:hypothetical protein CLCR_10971 [Cladophialophora carrionii]